MTEDHIMQPEKYEVIRLNTNVEFICMSIDKGDHVIAILPMICNLYPTDESTTRVSFQPYCALTDDINIVIKKEHILHRNELHNQYINFYDNASSKWMEMIEENAIPLEGGLHYEDEEEWDDVFTQNLDDYIDENEEYETGDTKEKITYH